MKAAVLAALVVLFSASSAVAQTNECAQTWTFDAAIHTLRNGVDVGGIGHSSKPFYRCVGGTTVMVIGQDGATWWRYTGNSWVFVGTSDPGGVQFLGAGPGATPPPECDHEWTFGPNHETLRDGVAAGSGVAFEYRCHEGVVYALTGDNNWWRWTGTTWVIVGPTVPAYASYVGETIRIAWEQPNMTNLTEWRITGAASTPLIIAASAGTSVVMPTTTSGEKVVQVSSVGCISKDATTGACLQTGSKAALPITVRVTPTPPPPGPHSPPMNPVVR